MQTKDLLKNKKFRIFLIVFLVASIFLFIFVLAKLVAVNSQCVNNPFVYAAESIIVSTEQLDLVGLVPEPLCSCSVGESIFYFDHEGVYRENPLLNTQLP